MTAPDFPPEIIEKAARALSHHADWLQAEDMARAVLAAVADDLRAKCAAGARAHWQGKYNAAKAEAERAYRRGMVEGARQLRATVDAEVESAYRVGANYVPCIRLENAAREVVASIEKESE